MSTISIVIAVAGKALNAESRSADALESTKFSRIDLAKKLAHRDKSHGKNALNNGRCSASGNNPLAFFFDTAFGTRTLAELRPPPHHCCHHYHHQHHYQHWLPLAATPTPTPTPTPVAAGGSSGGICRIVCKSLVA
uniref:Uncharacterized protein n=1 Tax=Vespula pensylvanica TaxID=30213 RepID=A0A834MY88_VESPE|nr:hypothetical protein H0235_018214 [Vespula pensylvanica]